MNFSAKKTRPCSLDTMFYGNALSTNTSMYFVPFTGNLTDINLTAISEVLMPLQNPFSLIAQHDKYKSKFSIFLTQPKCPLRYNDTIDTATLVMCAHAKAIHMAKLTNFAASKAAKQAIVKFIRTAVDERPERLRIFLQCCHCRQPH